jgi:hypothetical protein
VSATPAALYGTVAIRVQPFDAEYVSTANAGSDQAPATIR